MSLRISVYPKGPLDENTYLIIDENDSKIIIDPGYIGDDIISEIGSNDSLKYIILTHAHFDHFNSLNEYLSIYKNTKLIESQDEKRLIIKYKCELADIFVNEESDVKFNERTINFISTPGHTEGGMCILIDNFLFSGDTLFKNSIGNTSFETGNLNQLLNSIKQKLFILDDELVVYPGHGDKTTIGDEKRLNPFV